ncbi:MAG TPA: MFS transporter, partial [Stellaceae bacterium]|nr:MFS transporter [Stellaceae bacterium]
RQVGYVFAYVGMLSAVLQGGLIGRLAQRFGEERLVLAGLALLGFGLLLMPFARGLDWLLLALAALAVGMGLTQPSLTALVSRRAGGEEQGEVLGVTQSVGSLSRVLGPMAAGWFFASLGRASPFWWEAALVAAALFLAWPLLRGLEQAGLWRQEGPAE